MGNDRSMEIRQRKATFTAIWALAMLFVTYAAANTAAASAWTTLTAFTVAPPITIRLLANEPPQRLPESIQARRR